MPKVLPTYTCDLPNCPNIFLIPDSFSINADFTLLGPLGHAIPGFNCQRGQHFYCSMDHAIQGVTNCAANHLVPTAQTLLNPAT